MKYYKKHNDYYLIDNENILYKRVHLMDRDFKMIRGSEHWMAVRKCLPINVPKDFIEITKQEAFVQML